MAETDTNGRRVYVLPAEQIDRIRAYQTSQNLPSEVEAVRRLLDNALQMRDTSRDILYRLRSKFDEERDLRILARDNLAAHVLVREIAFQDDAIEFTLTTGERGRMGRDGNTYVPDEMGDWCPEPRIAKRKPASTSAPSWEPPKASGLDDEIPF